MKVIQNRKEWRHGTVMELIGSHHLSAEDAIEEAKKIEKFVFQDDFIVEVGSPEQRNTLKRFLENKSIISGGIALGENPKGADTRTQLYIALIGAGFKNPVVIQEHIKIAEQFASNSKDVSGQDLDKMDLKIKKVLGCCEAGVKEAEKRQHHLKEALKDPIHGPHRVYKNAVRSYSESTKRDPLNVVLEDLFQINNNNPPQNTKPNIAGPENIEDKQPKVSGSMPIGTTLYTESGSRIKLISAAQYQG